MYKEDFLTPDFISFRREVIKDMFITSGLFFIAFLLVFYSPSKVRDVCFLGILYAFWKTKRNYIFFAFFFIIVNTPAYFFDIFTLEAKYRLPIYTLVSGMSFNVIDLFVVLALLKCIVHHKSKFKFHVVQSLIPFLIVALILGFFAALWYGTTVSGFFNHIRAFFYITLIFSFSILVNNKFELVKFGYSLFPFLLLVIIDQIYVALTGKLIIAFFDPLYENAVLLNTISGSIRPAITAVLLVFYSFLFGFLLNRNKHLEIFSGISLLFITISFLAVIISATRIWITIYLLVFFIYLLFNKKLIKTAILVPYAGLLIFALLIALNLTDYFIENIWSRYYSFVESLFSNNITSYDTFASRVDYSVPRILKAIQFSPIIGVGFSDYLAKYYDPDLGGLNIVMTFGVVGTIVFLICYYLIIKKIIFHSKISSDNLSIDMLKTYLIGFSGMFLGFVTTWDFFSFYYTVNVFFITVFLGHIEVTVRDVILEKKAEPVSSFEETQLVNI